MKHTSRFRASSPGFLWDLSGFQRTPVTMVLMKCSLHAQGRTSSCRMSSACLVVEPGKILFLL